MVLILEAQCHPSVQLMTVRVVVVAMAVAVAVAVAVIDPAGQQNSFVFLNWSSCAAWAGGRGQGGRDYQSRDTLWCLGPAMHRGMCAIPRYVESFKRHFQTSLLNVTLRGEGGPY